MPQVADELTAALPQEARDAGARLYWAPGVETLAQTGVLAYDMVLPAWPRGDLWTPFRNRMPRAGRCYRLASGSMVHVKPDCRC
jgi:hypothetical protein